MYIYIYIENNKIIYYTKETKQEKIMCYTKQTEPVIFTITSAIITIITMYMNITIILYTLYIDV